MTGPQQTSPAPQSASPNNSDSFGKSAKKFGYWVVGIILFSAIIAGIVQCLRFFGITSWQQLWENPGLSICTVLVILASGCIFLLGEKNTSQTTRRIAQISLACIGLGIAVAIYSILVPIVNARFYFNRGDAYDAKGNSDLAIQDYTKALEFDPKFAAAYNNRGLAYFNEGKSNLSIQNEVYSDLAIQDFTKALEFDPKLALAYYNRGLAYNKNGDYDLAIQDFTKALEFDSKLALAYANRGLAYYKNGEIDEAIADYREALKLTNDPSLRKQVEQALKELEAQP